MSKLPKHLREAQAAFLARAEEQNRRMEALCIAEEDIAAEALRAELDAAQPFGTSSAEEFLRLLSDPEALDKEMLQALHFRNTFQSTVKH